jgi:hypothetical protein
MIGNRFLVKILLASLLLTGMSSAIARDAEQPTTPPVGVGAQYEKGFGRNHPRRAVYLRRKNSGPGTVPG